MLTFRLLNTFFHQDSYLNSQQKNPQTNHFDSFREALRKETDLSECDVRSRSYCAFANYEPRLRVRTDDCWTE